MRRNTSVRQILRQHWPRQKHQQRPQLRTTPAMGEKHYRQNRRPHHPRRVGQSQPATTTRQQLRIERHRPPIRVKTEAHRQSPEPADWLAVDLPNMRSLLHVQTMEHHHQVSHPSPTHPPQEPEMIEFTFEPVETVAEARWELEIMRYPEHAQHMIRTWQKLGDQGKSEIRQEAQYILEALDLHALLAQAWQDGHDTALLHGQSKNPHN